MNTLVCVCVCVCVFNTIPDPVPRETVRVAIRYYGDIAAPCDLAGQDGSFPTREDRMDLDERSRS